jgi:PAS domain S-box-containing protein
MKSRPAKYAVAIAMPFAALLIQLALRPVFEGIPFFLFFVVVFVSALLSGFFPALVSAVLSTALTTYFMQPQPAQIALFLVTGIGISWFVTSRQRWEAEQQRAEVDHLATIANVAPAIVWITDAGKSCTYVNDRWLEFSGRTREEELGFGWLSEMHPEDIPRCMPVFERAFSAHEPVEIEYRQRRHDGVYRWMLSRGVPRFDRKGTFEGYIGVALDIEDLRVAEELLRFAAMASETMAASLDYEATLRATAELAVPALADCVVVALIGEDGIARRVAAVHSDPEKHALAQKLLDKPFPQDFPEQVVERSRKMQPFVFEMNDEALAEMIPDPEHAAIVRALGTNSLLVVPIETRDRLMGTMSFLSVTPSRYGRKDIDLAGLLARRVAIAIDNARLYRAAVQANAAKDEFLATISHELRTPMTATLGWVRLLELGQVEPETMSTALKAIENSTMAQARIIDEILDVSSIVLGKFRMERGEVDLRAVVDAATQAVLPALSAKSITMNVDTERWSGVVHGDGNRLQQIVWNLLANSTKFGKRNGHIDVTVEREDSIARIVVSDDGSGIDPGFLPFVFDRFVQQDSGSARNHGGLGLGLAIVRHLVELHGGTVRAFSDGRDKGATFTVELPAS